MIVAEAKRGARVARASARSCSSTRSIASTRRSRTRSCRTSRTARSSLIGATTENPSFAVNAALLSRCKVFRLEPLGDDGSGRRSSGARSPTRSAASARERVDADDDALAAIAKHARGDARRALTTLEIGRRARGSQAAHARSRVDGRSRRRSSTRRCSTTRPARSTTTSSARSSSRCAARDPDAAIYWMMRMLEAGDDPLFVAAAHDHLRERGRRQRRPARARRRGRGRRRRSAAWACPRASTRSRRRALYLASAPKSNAVQRTRGSAPRPLIDEHGALPVPMKLRNAATKLMKEEGYGEGYKYAHDYEERRRPGRDVPARRARGRGASTSRPSAAKRRGSRRGSRNRGVARPTPT